jgi:hypothetical protein
MLTVLRFTDFSGYRRGAMDSPTSAASGKLQRRPDLYPAAMSGERSSAIYLSYGAMW